MNGDDGAQGTATNTAWRTIDRVNRARLEPGDRVLFEGASSFAGNLTLTPEDAGSSNAPVVIGSFGEEHAFRPLPPSPARAGGLDLRKKFGLNTGDRDFLGRPLTGPFPLGAIGTTALD